MGSRNVISHEMGSGLPIDTRDAKRPDFRRVHRGPAAIGAARDEVLHLEEEVVALGQHFDLS